jgi:Family of unknown function (DUF6491)
MRNKVFESSLCLVSLFCLSGALAEEPDSESDAGQPIEVGEGTSPIEHCFSVRSMTDFVAISDQHIYVQTRGRNHYLLSTEVCEGLQRSYQRQEVRFIPYGETVCSNDGSYIVYDAIGRDLPCLIVSIERVASRKEAKLIAESELGLGTLETVTPIDTDAPEDADAPEEE